MRRTPFSDRCSAFSRCTAQPGAGRRPEAGAPSTRPGARHKARRDPGPVREDSARVARGPVAILQRAIASALLTLISSKNLHARSPTPASFQPASTSYFPELSRKRYLQTTSTFAHAKSQLERTTFWGDIFPKRDFLKGRKNRKKIKSKLKKNSESTT